MKNINSYWADPNHTPNPNGDIKVIEFQLSANDAQCKAIIKKVEFNPFTGIASMDYDVHFKYVSQYGQAVKYNSTGSKSDYVLIETGFSVPISEAVATTYYNSNNEVVTQEEAVRENGGLNEGYTKTTEVNEGYNNAFDNIWGQMDLTPLVQAGTGFKNIMYPIGEAFLINHFSNHVEPYL